MSSISRKRSPASPTTSLEDALSKALLIYDKERRHVVPIDVAASHIGYKSASSGAARQTFASLGYFGLISRSRDGMFSVSSDVENYKFTPDPNLKQELLTKWLRNPQVFSGLLDKFPGSLPSDAVIRFELIQMGFSPTTADDVTSKFKSSIEFSNYYNNQTNTLNKDLDSGDNKTREEEAETAPPLSKPEENTLLQPNNMLKLSEIDRIPVRLSGGRKAHIEVPSPFFARDKVQLIAQINLILTEEDNDIGT